MLPLCQRLGSRGNLDTAIGECVLAYLVVILGDLECWYEFRNRSVECTATAKCLNLGDDLAGTQTECLTRTRPGVDDLGSLFGRDFHVPTQLGDPCFDFLLGQSWRRPVAA